MTFLQSFPWRGLLVYYLLGFVLEYYPPSTRARRGLYASAPFALAWTVATPYLFAGQQMQVGRTLTVAFAMVVAAVFLFFRYDVHITSARVRKAIIWLAGYSYTIYLVHSPLSKVLIGPRMPVPTDGWSYAGISVLMFGATDVYKRQMSPGWHGRMPGQIRSDWRRTRLRPDQSRRRAG